MPDPNKPAQPMTVPPAPSRTNRTAATPGSAWQPAPPVRVAPFEGPQFAPFTPPGADEARRAGSSSPVRVQPTPSFNPPAASPPPPFPTQKG